MNQQEANRAVHEATGETGDESAQIVWTDTGVAGATADFWYEDTYLYEQECCGGSVHGGATVTIVEERVGGYQVWVRARGLIDRNYRVETEKEAREIAARAQDVIAGLLSRHAEDAQAWEAEFDRLLGWGGPYGHQG